MKNKRVAVTMNNQHWHGSGCLNDIHEECFCFKGRELMRTKPPHLHASPVCAVKTRATLFTTQFFLDTIQIGPQINNN